MRIFRVSSVYTPTGSSGKILAAEDEVDAIHRYIDRRKAAYGNAVPIPTTLYVVEIGPLATYRLETQTVQAWRKDE